MKYDTCPRCLINPLPEPKVRYCGLSRVDNSTYICQECETEEAMIDAGLFTPATQEEQSRAERLIPN